MSDWIYRAYRWLFYVRSINRNEAEVLHDRLKNDLTEAKIRISELESKLRVAEIEIEGLANVNERNMRRILLETGQYKLSLDQLSGGRDLE